MFDGRNREIGNTMLSHMQGRQHLSELMLLYAVKATRTEAGRTRKVVLASRNVERLHLYPPCARVALTAKPREAFNLLGEGSTHGITYSGITIRSRQAMPRITEEDNKSIFDGSQNTAHGVPDPLLHAFPNPVLFCKRASQWNCLSNCYWISIFVASSMCPQALAAWPRRLCDWGFAVLA